MTRWRDVSVMLLAAMAGAALLGGCAMGGVASMTFYEPAVPDPAPGRVTIEKGTIGGSYYVPKGVEGRREHSFTREGTVSVTLQDSSYELRVFATAGRFTGSLALGLVFYIPIPMASGGSESPYVVRVELTCKDPVGCLVDPSRARFTGDADNGAIVSDCGAAPLTGGPRADPDGKWRLSTGAAVALSCGARASTPLAITLDLGDAIVIKDGSVRVPSVVLRRVVAYDGYW